jgi:2-amino-4-hydroxy-6-hydroxymethyldihydropteridine diphosphokinase
MRSSAILIGLGANLPSRAGLPAETLSAALGELSLRGVRSEAHSRFYRSPAWPDASDPPYVNAVARVSTTLAPEELLSTLHAVEVLFGRERKTLNAPRSLDLDILDFGGLVQDGPPMLPHPRMAERAFVLLPLAEIAPQWRHPTTGETLESLIAKLPPEALRGVLGAGASRPHF